ncbi:MFS transporter PfmaC like protein [Verticillium longisporum]|uniref:MFS transporter PfmaC like protein n=1 Tax=Verticillium longisporum TaxID=100787 RepID=A0A8I2Z1G3_VERLO|nr:MFS transporter PfmaC like protein [Verticillium longisporum]KAG7117950.1 MFS transporter PfmaC like protein [Verticillium longisporum]KAG7149074.1 MFS transporter PfmaC like protein [Verticillium longisporum]
MGFTTAFQRLAIAKKHHRSPEERAFVRRLDIFLMSFGAFSQVIKYLDQTNINTAYVSGMKEDLHLMGNELNLFTTFFNIGYCVMLIPSLIIMTHVRPSIWLPSLEIAWGVITGLLAITKNARQVYALRFALGFLESSAWPGMAALLMHWYTPSELGKRMGFFSSASSIGAMMSGALQIAILDRMDGSHGLPGWRWLFVINSIMTVFVGALGFVFLPDFPHKPNPWAKWFKDEYKQIAVDRLKRHGKAESRRITWQSAKRTAGMWITYFVPTWWVIHGLSGGGAGFFGVFLKSLLDGSGQPLWTVREVNALPIGAAAIQVVTLWFWCSLSDMLESRWTILIVQCVIALIPAVTMTTWTWNSENVPLNAAYASFFIANTCLAGGNIFMAWLAELLPHEPEARSLIIGASVTAIYALAAGIMILMWPASKAPYFNHGWPTTIATWTITAALCVALHYLDRRYLLPKRIEFAEANGLVVNSSSDGGSVEPKSAEEKTKGPIDTTKSI